MSHVGQNFLSTFSTVCTHVKLLMCSQALNLYIGICWPLVANHWRQINVIAGRVIYRSTDEDAIKEAEITFDLLKELLPDNTEFLDVEYIRRKREKKEDTTTSD